MKTSMAAPRAERHGRLSGAASGVVGLAVAVACALPRSGQAREATIDEIDAKPNVVLASTLAAEPSDGPVPVRLADSAASPSDDSAAAVPVRWTSSAELSAGHYRWSASRGSLDVGMTFAAPPQDGRRFDIRSENSGPWVPTLPSFTLGLRRDAQAPTASTLLDRATGTARDSAYVSKIGLEWKPPRSQVNFLREGLGIRLDGNDRMTVRLRKGVLGVYMQRKF